MSAGEKGHEHTCISLINGLSLSNLLRARQTTNPSLANFLPAENPMPGPAPTTKQTRLGMELPAEVGPAQ